MDAGDVALERAFQWGPLLAVIGVFAALVVFVYLFYKHTDAAAGMIPRESMDIAQIARNLSEGSGFVTHFVRPFNAALAGVGESSMVEVNHGPLYPCAVAVLFRARGSSGQAVAWTSMLFLILTAAGTFLLGRALFDWPAGLLAAVLFATSAPVLTAGTSGGEWAMAALWFVLLLICVSRHHASAADGWTCAAWAALAGLAVSLLYMTHHVFIFAAVPAAVYFGLTGRARKLCLAAFLIAVVVAAAPWAWRNAVVTGAPVLGVNAWDLVAGTAIYPGDTFYRSTAAAGAGMSKALLFPLEHFPAFSEKLARGLSDAVAALAAMMGLAGLPFAVVCTLYRFRSAEANAIRGLMYGMLPVALTAVALFRPDREAVLLLCPPGFVLGAGYFLLLLNSRRLHPVYSRMIVGALVLVAAFPALVTIAWGTQAGKHDSSAERYFAHLGNRGVEHLIYTDVPWVAAWRTRCRAVWLPRSDQDVRVLESEGIPMQVVILTPESASYGPDEAWYLLHRVKAWREYVRDPEAGVRQILKEAGLASADADGADKFLRRVKRNFAVAESIAGFVSKAPSPDPLVPDDIQVLLSPELAPSR